MVFCAARVLCRIIRRLSLRVIVVLHFIQSCCFIDQSSQYKLAAEIESELVVVKVTEALKCFITDYHLDRQCCTSLEEFA